MSSRPEASAPREEAVYFHRKLLRWFRFNARQFPWRKTDDPYLVLLSEVLLQRTQAPQVMDNYPAIVEALPTPSTLAEAPVSAVEEVLRPLGLTKRAASLKRMGEDLVVRYEGRVPSAIADLMELPGVGRYIATATAAFAAGSRVAVVDANVIRVLGRFFGVSSAKKRPRDDPALWELAQSLLPRRRPADYNRALIDFAALVCRARRPLCSECALRRRCKAAPTFLIPRAASRSDPVRNVPSRA